MNTNRSLNKLILSLLPKLYDLGLSLSTDSTKSELLISDAYTAIMISQLKVVEEVDTLISDETVKNNRVRKILFKLFLSQMLDSCEPLVFNEECTGFHILSLEERAFVFLFYREKMDISETQELLQIDRVRFLELLYSVRAKLLGKDKLNTTIPAKLSVIPTTTQLAKGEILAIKHGTASIDVIDKLGQQLGRESGSLRLDENRQTELQFIDSLIPKKVLSKETKERLAEEITMTTQSFLPENRLEKIQKKVVSFMTSPVIEI